MIFQHTYLSRATLSLSTLLFTAFTFIPEAAFAAPLLRCKIEQSGMTFMVDASPRLDPYGVAAVVINKNFRFKAVMIGNQEKIDYIKIYAYYQGKRQAILMHESKFLAPSIQSAQIAPFQLTGMNYLYSPHLNRELHYGCSLIESAEK